MKFRLFLTVFCAIFIFTFRANAQEAVISADGVSEAEEYIRMQEKEILALENELGADDPKVADALSQMLNIYLTPQQERTIRYFDGKTKEDLIKRILAIREKSFDFDHPKIADTLVLMYSENINGSRNDISLQERIVNIYKKSLSAVDPKLLNAVQNLASDYVRQKEYTQAIDLLIDTLNALRSASTNYDRSSMVGLLATAYEESGDFRNSDELYQERLDIYRQAVDQIEARSSGNKNFFSPCKAFEVSYHNRIVVQGEEDTYTLNAKQKLDSCREVENELRNRLTSSY